MPSLLDMRSDAELRELVPHLCYELRMLLMTDQLLLEEQERPPNRDDPRDWTVHNSLFEAHTVHARSLFNFFFRGPENTGDATAGDFVPDWKKHRPKAPAVLRRVPPRVGQEIAHLTYGRLAYKSEDDRRWPNWDITNEIVNALNAWLRHAPGYVGPQIQESLKQYHGRRKVQAV
jgi:hypothetical protein